MSRLGSKHSYEAVLIHLGERIVFLRKRAGLSQRELAYACGWDKSNLRKLEKGRTNPTIKTLVKVCSVLKVNFKDLFD
jgi:transcriptional regulator with XRE-family HTH domain